LAEKLGGSEAAARTMSYHHTLSTLMALRKLKMLVGKTDH
jgi:hypothetical protein